MKTFILCAALAVGVLTNTVMAQSVSGGIKQLIDAQSYVFEAQWIQPMRGTTRQLTTPYILTVGKDTVVADLPFIGRAYTASFDMADNGIKFTSTHFDYAQKTERKGWGVTIKVKDDSQGTQMFLTVFDNGSASLQVTSNNRDGISFNGYIHAKAGQGNKPVANQ
jgi:hypothetical protein